MVAVQTEFPGEIRKVGDPKPMSICLCIDGGLDTDEEKLQELMDKLVAVATAERPECKITGGIATTHDLRNTLIRLGIGVNPLTPPPATA